MDKWQQKIKQLSQWWDTPSGNVLFQAEYCHLSNLIQTLFGYQMVLVADKKFLELSNLCRTNQVLRLDPVTSSVEQLPDNTDILVIPHLLSYFDSPELWLQAISKQLASNGKLIITGYRKISLLGWQQIYRSAYVRGLPNWQNNMFKLKRLLRKHGYAINETTNIANFLVTPTVEINDNLLNPSSLGNITCLIASKKIVTVKSIKPNWKTKTQTSQRVLSSWAEKNYD